jgi:hypothetical protein
MFPHPAHGCGSALQSKCLILKEFFLAIAKNDAEFADAN